MKIYRQASCSNRSRRMGQVKWGSKSGEPEVIGLDPKRGFSPVFTPFSPDFHLYEKEQKLIKSPTTTRFYTFGSISFHLLRRCVCVYRATAGGLSLDKTVPTNKT